MTVQPPAYRPMAAAATATAVAATPTSALSSMRTAGTGTGTTAAPATVARWSVAVRHHHLHWYYGPPRSPHRVTASSSSSCAASGPSPPPTLPACSCYGRLCGSPARRHDMISGVDTTPQRITAVVRPSFAQSAALVPIHCYHCTPLLPPAHRLSSKHPNPNDLILSLIYIDLSI